MKLPDKVYDILKWIVVVVLPAMTTLYVMCAEVWGWGYSNEIAKSSAAVCAFLGAILGISTAEYRK